MTCKDYKLIAEVLSTAQDSMLSQEHFWEFCALMANRLHEQNSQFHIGKFMVACGAEPEK